MTDFAKRHYQTIAMAVQSASRAAAGYANAYEIISRVVVCLADEFERDNPRFDRKRFEEACIIGAKVTAKEPAKDLI